MTSRSLTGSVLSATVNRILRCFGISASSSSATNATSEVQGWSEGCDCSFHEMTSDVFASAVAHTAKFPE